MLKQYNKSKRPIAGHVNPQKPTLGENRDRVPPTYALALPLGF